jgi:hypothetical protein
MARSTRWTLALLPLASLGGCPEPTPSPDASVGDAPADAPADGGADAGPAMPAALARYCGERDWLSTLEPARVGTPEGRRRLGFTTGPGGGAAWEAGTVESTRVWPTHPFLVRTIRLALQGSGRVRVRLVCSYGRSYPASHLPESRGDDVDVVPPVELDLVDASADVLTEIDVSAAGAVLEPTIPYHVVYEHLGERDPSLEVVETPTGIDAESFLLYPSGSDYLPAGTSYRDAFAIGGDYRVELVGEHACAWSESERWTTASSFGPVGGRVHVADLDGDGHDDFVASGGTRPVAFRGDGDGRFVEVAPSPFPESEGAGLPYFADLDGDGDLDAIVTEYTSADADGDLHLIDGDDCDDTSATVPGGGEIAGNGIDDDCDGVADDGTSTADADMDGVTIAGGDCDDTVATTYPGAPELHNSRDDDCDRRADEPFVHHVLLQDASGAFVRQSGAGLEIHGATAAGALADFDRDGHLDFFVGHWLHHYPDPVTQPSLLFRGRGDGTFEDVTAAAGLAVATPRPVYGVTWTDWDGDARQDLLVSTYQLQDDFLWRNLGDGTFVDAAPTVGVAHDEARMPGGAYPGGHGYGAEFGDLDGDGDLDLFQSNLAHPRTMPWSDPSRVLLNQGAPSYRFEDHTAASGYVYNEGDANVHLGDLDADGDLDLVVTSHYGLHQRVYRNEGGATFVDRTYEMGVFGRAESAIWFDADEDGDLDLLTADRGVPHLFVSRLGDAGGPRWVELLLHGSAGAVEAIGARITIRAGARTLVREVRTTGALANRQASRWVHVGLGDAASIDEVSVRWPDGTMEAFTGVAAGARWQLDRGTGRAR